MKRKTQSTSKDAFNGLRPEYFQTCQYRIYQLLKRGQSLTNSEIAKTLGWSINRVTPRVHELRKIGAVVEDCKRPCRVTGYMAISWKRSKK